MGTGSKISSMVIFLLLFLGFGRLFNDEPKQLVGSFDYTDFEMIDDYWTRYEGEFKGDDKEGKGKLYLTNGEYLEGNFKDDLVNGQGIFHL